MLLSGKGDNIKADDAVVAAAVVLDCGLGRHCWQLQVRIAFPPSTLKLVQAISTRLGALLSSRAPPPTPKNDSALSIHIGLSGSLAL